MHETAVLFCVYLNSLASRR